MGGEMSHLHWYSRHTGSAKHCQAQQPTPSLIKKIHSNSPIPLVAPLVAAYCEYKVACGGLKYLLKYKEI